MICEVIDMNIIRTEKLPAYRFLLRATVGGLVFTSGQIPVDPAHRRSRRGHRRTS